MKNSILILGFLIVSLTNHVSGQYSGKDLNFIIQNFTSPPNGYRPIQYTMNHDLNETSVEELLSYGVGGIQHSVAYNNYLQDEEKWGEAVQDIQLAKKSHMQVWIHDERGYPSGAAGGLVVDGHPEYEARGLVRITQRGSGKVPVVLLLPSDINFIYASISPLKNGEPDYKRAREVSVSGEKVEATGLKGEWQLSVFGIRILDHATQAQSTIRQFEQTGRYPSLLSENAIQRFIELTHQNYANHINNIGDKVELFYSNEPNLMSTYWKNDSQSKYAYIPWDEHLPSLFQSMHKYNLIPCLNALYEGSSLNARTIRLHFYQTVAKAFSQNYTGQITQWCKKNGVKSSGHFLLEEYMICQVIYYGNMLKALRNFDIPACDIPVARDDVTNKLKKFNWNIWMPKFISSSAYLEDKTPMVTALVDPIIGGFGKTDFSPETKYLRRTINMSYLCGINQVTTYIPYQDYEEKDYQNFNEYVGRLSLMLRGAKNEASIAIYYPIETFQASYIASSKPWHGIVKDYNHLQEPLEDLATAMFSNHLDFNFITDDAILNASFDDGCLNVGTHQYTAIVMPGVEVISLDVLKKLKKITDAGIEVYWVNKLPVLGGKNEEHKKVQKAVRNLAITNNVISELRKLNNQNTTIKIESDKNSLFFNEFFKNGYLIHYLINDNETNNEVTISSEVGKFYPVTIFDPMDGSFQQTELPFSGKLEGYGSLFVVEKLDAPTAIDK